MPDAPSNSCVSAHLNTEELGHVEVLRHALAISDSGSARRYAEAVVARRDVAPALARQSRE